MTIIFSGEETHVRLEVDQSNGIRRTDGQTDKRSELITIYPAATNVYKYLSIYFENNSLQKKTLKTVKGWTI